MGVLLAAGTAFEIEAPVLVVGAGACGLTAALAAREGGAEVLVVERDRVPRGSTALSSGMIPACGTAAQRARGVADSRALMAADIMRKAKGEADAALVEAVVAASGPAVDWLAASHGVDLPLVEGFLYPGHSVARMHAPPARTGAALMDMLASAAERAGVDVFSEARVRDLLADADGTVRGVALERPDGKVERIGCGALVLACNGFGGNREMVRAHIPEMADAAYFGHPGNQGDAVLWGRALGAATRHMG
ncbi:MAG: FAD-dependent oxidoreductase, partial [Alphaproteobacteria bacterium]|nr:FAD-dependent oxidoreductase [Alphaproteobacteria bacterium]